jgi:hypothetical protein
VIRSLSNSVVTSPGLHLYSSFRSKVTTEPKLVKPDEQEIQTPEEIKALYKGLENGYASANVTEFIVNFDVISKIPEENAKFHSLIGHYLNKKWIEKFDENGIYYALHGLSLSNFKSAGDGSVLMNLSSQLSTISISTPKLISSVFSLTNLGLNKDILNKIHHQQIYARILETEDTDKFQFLTGLSKLGFIWSEIPVEIQNKLLYRIPNPNNITLTHAINHMSAFSNMKFTIIDQNVDTIRKINVLSASIVAQVNDTGNQRNSPSEVLQNLVNIGFDRNNLSPEFLEEFLFYLQDERPKKDFKSALNA